MKRIITIAFTILWTLNSFSQEFGVHWISYPLPNDSSEVLFRRTYALTSQPQEAQITFISSGKVKVFVNERNITNDITFGNPDSTNVVAHTYDITRLLNAHYNTIAVWYAPTKGAPISKQLSLEFYGKDFLGNPFYHKADGSWSCQILKGSYTKGSKETFDSQNYRYNWKQSDFNKAKWLHPLGAYQHDKPLSLTESLATWPESTNDKLHHVLKPINSRKDSLGIEYIFDREFKGTIRLTLRGAKKGETLLIDGFTYICNGELDEQAFRRFTTSRQRTVTVRGDQHFKASQITQIEALEY